jgi:trimethylamine:corrinoid methyltransferase-like protein
MRLASLLVLSDEEIRLIHESSLDILQETGVRVLSPRLLQALGERGLKVQQSDRSVTCSHEQLLMDGDITACCRRLVRGVTVDRETVAVDLIKKRGPQGESYLTAEHTLRWLHGNEYLAPELTVTGPFSTWEADGSPDTYELARRKAAAYQALAAPALDGKRQAALQEVLSAFRPSRG